MALVLEMLKYLQMNPMYPLCFRGNVVEFFNDLVFVKLRQAQMIVDLTRFVEEYEQISAVFSCMQN